MRRGRRAGMTLGAVAMAIALAASLAFVMAGSTMIHVRFSARVRTVQEARNLAESALANTVNHIMATPGLGHDRETEPPVPNLPEGSEVIVTFDPEVAAARDVLCSYNNLPPSDEDPPPPSVLWPPPPVPFGSEQHGIPPGGVLVASRATVNGVTARAVTIVWFPLFPYAIAASGPVNSSGPLLVASAPAAPPGEALLNATGMGSMASNSVDPRAIYLTGSARITGNAVSSGGIVLEDQARVDGAMEPCSSPVGMPSIDIESLDPATLSMPNIVPMPASVTGPNLSGFNRADQGVVVNGDLNLDDAVLYVKGDLHVKGKILGHGVILATGSARIDKGGSFTADSVAAIAAGGDITITGDGANQSAFAGLLYTKGNVNASNITLVGSLVAAGESSDVILNSANALHVPEYTRIELGVTTTTTTFTYDTSNNPVYIGGNGISGLVTVNWVGYTDDQGRKVYALADVPGTEPKPLPQFWDVLTEYMRSKGMQDSAPGGRGLYPGWWNVHQLKSNNDGQWYPVTHFLKYVKTDKPVPGRQVQKPPTSVVTTRNSKFVLDLNRFISPADRLRLLMWRVL